MNEKKNQPDPQWSEEQELNQRLHQKRIRNFTLNLVDEEENEVDISVDPQPSGAETGGAAFSQAEEVEAISSFSDPTKAQPMESGKPTAAEKAAAQKARSAHRQRNRSKRKKNRRIFRAVWAVMIVFVGLSLGQYMVAGINDMLAIGRTPIDITVDIPKDPTLEQVVTILEERGVIDNPEFFTLYVKLTSSDDYFRKGTFQVSTGMDYEALINTLQNNSSRLDVVDVTFREGMTVQEVAALLEEKGVCDGEEVLKLCNSTTYDETYEMLPLIPDNEGRVYRLEGYLFPDTYQFYVDENPENAVQRLIRNCNLKLTNNIRAKAEERGFTIDELLTLASIVQLEAANKEDMYKVSSVLQNRLRDGQEYDIYTLDCDSTVYYPYRSKEEIPEAERETFVSAYNTYANRGLPPGPICSPGMDAIDAVLNPEETNYYYFCHDENGKAYYARTSWEHEQNLKKAGLR